MHAAVHRGFLHFVQSSPGHPDFSIVDTAVRELKRIPGNEPTAQETDGRWIRTL